jgi:hypothetical protein
MILFSLVYSKVGYYTYSYTFDYLQKDFPKEFAKTKQVVQRWSKMLKKEKQSIHI